MFVRWKRQLLRKSVKYLGMEPKYVWYAVLIESRWINGKPKQRFIKHLAGISEDELSHAIYRQEFWRRVELALLDFTLDLESRRKIEASLEAKVRRSA